MTFVFGLKSETELKGVHPVLVTLVRLALTKSSVDFAVHDGLRTMEEQRALVANGASNTLASRHLTGHAVDLVPYVNGKLRWEWGPIFRIADAMKAAAIEMNVPLVWGACWDVNFRETIGSAQAEADAYAARQRKAGKRVFADGPHYELPRKLYP